VRMRVESLTRQRQVLQTVWPVRIVRIDDSSCWVVVVGKPRRTSSSNSGIAKTSADLALVSVIIEAFVIERWYHMCYTVYIFFVSADLHLQVQHGPHIKCRSIEVYANAELRERAIHRLLTHGCPTNVAGWKNQSLQIKRLSTHSSPPSKNPPLLENAVQRLIYLIVLIHKPLPPFIIYRSDSYASKPPLPNPRSRHWPCSRLASRRHHH